MCTEHSLCVPAVLLEVTAPLPWCQHQQVSVSALSLSVKPDKATRAAQAGVLMWASLSRAFEQSLLSWSRCHTGTNSLRAGGNPQEEPIIAPALLGFYWHFQLILKGDLVPPFPLNCGITSHRTLICTVLPQIQQMADEASTEMDKLLAAKTKELLG